MHIRTAVWIAVVCAAIWLVGSVCLLVTAGKELLMDKGWLIFISYFITPMIGQAGLLTFLVVFAIKGGRQPKSGRRNSRGDSSREDNGG